MNVRFDYLYRDAGNYKKWGDIVFTNKTGFEIDSIREKIESNLIDGVYFEAKKVRVEELHFEDHDRSLDHDWHEFNGCSATDEIPDDVYKRDIVEFIDEIAGTGALLMCEK